MDKMRTFFLYIIVTFYYPFVSHLSAMDNNPRSPAEYLFEPIVGTRMPTDHTSSTQHVRKIVFQNQTKQLLMVYFMGVLPIINNPKTGKDEPLHIPPDLQKNFSSFGLTLHPRDRSKPIVLSMIQEHGRVQDFRNATAFYAISQGLKSNSTKIEDGAHYRFNIAASNLLIHKIMDNQ